jgi:hypothetical protein
MITLQDLVDTLPQQAAWSGIPACRKASINGRRRIKVWDFSSLARRPLMSSSMS